MSGGAPSTILESVGTAYRAQQSTTIVNLTLGQHTAVITNLGTGAYFQLDGFRAIEPMLNDSDPQLVYAGGWTYSGARNAGDFGNAVEYSTTTGDSVTLEFYGTGVEFYAPTATNGSSGNFVLDGGSA